MSKKRKNYSPESKVEILKKHLVDKVAVSDLCDQFMDSDLKKELGFH